MKKESTQINAKFRWTFWLCVIYAFARIKVDARRFLPLNTPILRVRYEAGGKVQKWNITVKDVL